jgi:hypothetical protein
LFVDSDWMHWISSSSLETDKNKWCDILGMYMNERIKKKLDVA